MLGEKALKLVDNLSRTLQQKTLSTAEGHRAAMITCDTLLVFDLRLSLLIWDKVTQYVLEVGINDLVLHCKRRVPMRFKEGNCDPQYPSSVIDLYQPVCNESFIKQSTVYHIICQTIMLIRL